MIEPPVAYSPLVSRLPKSRALVPWRAILSSRISQLPVRQRTCHGAVKLTHRFAVHKWQNIKSIRARRNSKRRMPRPPDDREP